MKIKILKPKQFMEAYEKAKITFNNYDFKTKLKVCLGWMPLTLLVLQLFGFNILGGFQNNVLISGMMIKKRWLNWLWVIPKKQKKGFGTKMFRYAKRMNGELKYNPLNEVKGFYKKVDV